jgi:LDH2 family malate/lactate/ureidoglycolate dehydrogenase
MKPDLFVPKDEYLKRMDTLVQRVHALPTAEGVDEILMPGEKERRLEATRRRTGLPYHPKEVQALQNEAAEVKLPPLPVANAPYASNTP